MAGGTYLCYEGVEKIYHKLKGDDHDHDVPAAMIGPEAEAKTISGAIRTDLILSAEIMVIALKEVIDEGFLSRTIIMVVVALMITVIVYGVVALIVKMDDIGLSLAGRSEESSQRLGRLMVAAMPVVLTWLSIIGTAAMLWVGGHIIIVGAHELGWDGPYDLVHDLEDSVSDVGGVGGVLGWLVNTALSALVGVVIGAGAVAVMSLLTVGSHDADPVASH